MFLFFFFNDTATAEIYTLSLHDALPIFRSAPGGFVAAAHVHPLQTETFHVVGGTLGAKVGRRTLEARAGETIVIRSEEHTSELQSRQYIVCRLLLEKNT